MKNYHEQVRVLGEHRLAGTEPDRVQQEIPTEYFQGLANLREEGFEFLREWEFLAVKEFMAGMAFCEEGNLSYYGGSVSLINPAYRVVQRRPLEESADIAMWIVTNHDNPYTPFDFRKTRGAWIEAAHHADDPVEVAMIAEQLSRTGSIKAAQRARKEIVRQAVARSKKGKVPTSPEVRRLVIEEMEREAGWPECR